MLPAVNGPVDRLPEVALVPVHAPEAVHDVALVLDQVKVDAALYATLAGLADKVTVGGVDPPALPLCLYNRTLEDPPPPNCTYMITP